jgi:hypothetical protein
MTTTDRYELSPDAVLQLGDGEALIVKLNAEDMFALNDTGAEIVQRIADGQAVLSVIEELARVYNAGAEDVARDVHRLVTELVDRGLLVPAVGAPRS